MRGEQGMTINTPGSSYASARIIFKVETHFGKPSAASFGMGHTRSTNRSSSLSHLGLVLAAFYLNLTLDTANASEHHSYGGGGFYPPPPMMIPPELWPEILTRLAIGGVGGYGNQGGNAAFYNQGANNGYANNGGYYDDLFAQRNSYDVGKGFGNGYDYGRGSVVGGGYRELDGRNKGHTASGFSNSYRKDESGDRFSYYDDGLGHHGRINYGAHDARFRDQGGALGRGGYHNSNLSRYGTGGTGRYGDSVVYSRGGDRGGHTTGGVYGIRRDPRIGLVPPPPPLPIPDGKRTGIYVIPMPDRLFFDQTPPPL